MAAVIFFKLCYYSTIFYCLFLTCSVSPISSSTEILRNIAILAIISTAGILFLLRLSIRLLWILQHRQNSFMDIFRSLQAAFILLIRFAIISSRLIRIISCYWLFITFNCCFNSCINLGFGGLLHDL